MPIATLLPSFMVLPDLPLELWLEITQYLPSPQIQRMISLNRSLMNIAINELYKDGRLFYES